MLQLYLLWGKVKGPQLPAPPSMLQRCGWWHIPRHHSLQCQHLLSAVWLWQDGTQQLAGCVL